MPALANDYRLCHLYNIDAYDREDGPFIIAQEACDPADELMVTTVFLLRRDGIWIDEMAQALIPEERKFLVFYDSSKEAALALERLVGPVVIERHALSVANLRARVANLQGGGYISMRAALAERYRAWKRERPATGR